ncbi:MAG: hypothetical protein QNJ63_26100 [Calothrix sp. MO_192.B10]|nr:hypothetical protein [Calothrix sp. MO_192.B10]
MTSITKTVTINVFSDDNGRYLCRISPSVDQPSHEIRCCGQSEEHAIAIALEQLASQYRQIAEKRQNKDWEAVERSASGEPIEKRYHVILHYERIIKAESKFEARLYGKRSKRNLKAMQAMHEAAEKIIGADT